MTQRKSATARPVHGDAEIIRRAVRYLERIGRLDPLQVGVGTDLADILDEALKSGAVVRIRAANVGAVPLTKRTGRMRLNQWTEDEDDILRACHEQGMGYAQIAEEVPGRSPDACKARAEYLGLTREPLQPPWTADEDRRLQELIEAGKTQRAIAAELNRSQKAVQGRVHKIGLQKMERPPMHEMLWSVEEMGELRDRWQSGERVSAIAAAMGRTEYGVNQKLFALKLFGTRPRPAPIKGTQAKPHLSAAGRILARRRAERQVKGLEERA